MEEKGFEAAKQSGNKSVEEEKNIPSSAMLFITGKSRGSENLKWLYVFWEYHWLQ